MSELMIYFDNDGTGYRTYYEACQPSEVLALLPLYSNQKAVLFAPTNIFLSYKPIKGIGDGWRFELDNVPKIELNSMFGGTKVTIVLDEKTSEFFNDITSAY